jgi:Cu+-exporting ATPase
MGISSIMVTGDNWATASAIAKEVGIEKVFAETDPLGKADRIKDLQVSFQCKKINREVGK